MGQFSGKTAVVTGAGSGIGRAAAIAFAREGAYVIVSDIDEKGGEETEDMILAMNLEDDDEEDDETDDNGGDFYEREELMARFIPCDVTREAEVESLMEQALALTFHLDYAFNNAGVGGGLSLLQDKTEDEWDSVIGVNLKGIWLCMKYELRIMQNMKTSGAIVNMASVAGLVGFRRGSLYSASKHGVIGLTRSAALENARKGIRINAICPSFTDTPMVREMFTTAPPMAISTVESNPMHRLGTPEEIAEAVVWLCSDKASFITGQALAVDGGLTAS